MKQSSIHFDISLSAEQMPSNIEWSASDSGIEGTKKAKAMLLSVWDEKDPGTLRIDLWTDKMMVEEMQQFMYETLQSMGDTYQRATGDSEGAAEIKTMSTAFAKKVKLI